MFIDLLGEVLYDSHLKKKNCLFRIGHIISLYVIHVYLQSMLFTSGSCSYFEHLIWDVFYMYTTTQPT